MILIRIFYLNVCTSLLENYYCGSVINILRILSLVLFETTCSSLTPGAVVVRGATDGEQL